MEQIHKLVLCLLPNQVCNFRCDYCYISQLEDWKNPEKLNYSPGHMAKCLSKERLGGVSLINLTGEGETFLAPQINEIITEFLKEGHYVEIVTNGTVRKRIRELLQIEPELLERLFFKMSFHYKELLRTKQMDLFFDTVREIKKSPASFTLELMAYDDIENEIDEIQRVCMKEIGALCHLTVGRDDTKKEKSLLSKHENSEYKTIWSSFDSAMFDFKMSVLGVKRKEFCYAGKWSLSINLYTGEAQPCYWQPYNQNVFEHPDQPIKFEPVGKACLLPYCYNAHAHMTWGVLPNVVTPTYCEMRNRVCQDGSEFLKPGCKAFFQSKLKDGNVMLSKKQESLYIVRFPFLYTRWLFRNWPDSLVRIKRYLKRIAKSR